MDYTSSNKPIIIVLGKLCSGKGTFCKFFTSKPLNYHHVTTSDIVKRLTGLQTRSTLQFTETLDADIASELINIIKTNPKTIIDGIRQPSIIDAIINAFGISNVELIWLDVPDDVRLQRFNDRQDKKDDQSFEDAEQGDIKLGLLQVESIYKNMSNIVFNV